MTMKQHYCMAPDELKQLNNEQLRERFLITDLFVPDQCVSHYVQEDRIIVFGLMPASKSVALQSELYESNEQLLSRRELGLVNLGGTAEVIVGETSWTLKHKDCLYIGMGERAITVKSVTEETAKIYGVACPAHKSYPDGVVDYEKAVKNHLGTQEKANARTIVKYIVPETISTCQLVMGITTLEAGSVWNTMPPHTHMKRQEVYLYCDASDEAIFHFMGPADNLRSVIIHNEEAIISPSWSVHFAAGTAAYSFIWAMTGENQDFGDVKPIDKLDLK